MSPAHEVWKCPLCKKNVTKTQKSVPCACCYEYVHIDCGKLTIEEYNFLDKHKRTKYICPNCPSFSSDNIQEEIKKGFSALSASLEKDIELKLLEYKRMFQEKLDEAVNVFKIHIDKLSMQCGENKTKISDFKSDLNNCCNLIKHVDDVNGDKIRALESQANTNLRRLNRSNIIIRGLPKSIIDLRIPIIKIASICNVSISISDIQHCTYFGGDKAVLVKFNSVQLRDEIMINYHKGNAIVLKDVIGGSIESRVYLNDHLTPAAKKLVDLCKELKLKQKIKKYVHLNYDVPKAKIEMNSGAIKILNYDDCLNILNEGSNASPNQTGT